MEKVELLAPAGSMESLYAAINNGADAVYLGGSKFSARAYASNFDNENMKKAVDYCHSYNVSIYVTMNTLLKENELQEAIKYVGYLYEIGVDALIIQDLGLLKLIKERYPDFEVHASTQMTVHNGEGALYFKDKGFHRIVLSRELSLDEIKYISKDLNIETEIFVHGALCVSYSGKCLMSSMIGGRSGNRGRCAQPCRKEYILESTENGNKKGYLLSPKDMCTIDNMKEIINSGTYSLKVEGRMKRPEYVAGVVENYRKAIDKELKKGSFDLQSGKKVLLQLFNREGFSNAYMKKNTGRDMMSYSFPKNTGVELGKVDNDGSINLKQNIGVGDGVRYKDKGFTVSKILLNGNEVKTAKIGDKVKLFPKEYKKNDILFRTSSKELFDSLEGGIRPYIKKISLTGEVEFKLNQPIKLKTTFNDEEFYVEGDIVEVAERKPLDMARVEETLMKSGDYPYKFGKVIFNEFEDGFLRVASLNNLRRELFDKIIKATTAKYRRRRENVDLKSNIKIKEAEEFDIVFTCTTKEQLETLVENNVKNIAVDMFNKSRLSVGINDLEGKDNVNLYLLLPEIIKTEFNGIINVIEKCKPHIKGLITSNAGIIKKYKDELVLIGDYKLNVYNSESLEFYRQDLNNVSLSLEVTRKEIKEATKKKIKGVSYVVYGKPEVMVSEYCPIGSTFGNKNTTRECNEACTRDEFTLVDEVSARFRVMTDKFCRSHILNNVPLNLIEEIEDMKTIGIDSFRVDFKDESKQDILRVLDMINGKEKVEGKYYTKGHYRRGVE